jgi:hypothetical protein
MIPKIIHQIWYQGINKLPPDPKNKSTIIQKNHPNWEYILWDNTKIQKVFKNNTKILNIYNNLSYLHQKIDFIKYCILYEYGGVYLDTDITLLKPFDDILTKYQNYDCILSNLNLNKIKSYIFCFNKQCINNGVILSQKNSKFMLYLINNINQNHTCKFYDLNSSMCINRLTGPGLVSTSYNNYPNKDIIKILDYSYFEPCILKDLCDIKSNTITVHHHATTWINPQLTNMIYYILKYELVLCVLLFIIVSSIIFC